MDRIRIRAMFGRGGGRTAYISVYPPGIWFRLAGGPRLAAVAAQPKGWSASGGVGLECATGPGLVMERAGTIRPRRTGGIAFRKGHAAAAAVESLRGFRGRRGRPYRCTCDDRLYHTPWSRFEAGSPDAWERRFEGDGRGTYWDRIQFLPAHPPAVRDPEDGQRTMAERRRLRNI